MKWLGGTLAYIISVVVCLGIAIVTLVWTTEHVFRTSGPLTEPLVFEVARNTTLDEVATNLDAIGAVTSGTIFRFGARLANYTKPIQSGSFILPEQASMQTIMDILVSRSEGGPRYRVTARLKSTGAQIHVKDRFGPRLSLVENQSHAIGDEPSDLYLQAVDAGEFVSYYVTVVEGLTSWQIVRALEMLPFLIGDIDEIPVEGSLAPDTYHVIPHTRTSALIGKLRSRQEWILAEEWKARSPDLPFSTPLEALTLASIIEKETGIGSERDLISSVYINRLNKGMRLQADPTVIYGITQGREPLGRGLYKSDLKKVENPYNTYRHNGFPPTPIANPGKKAIHAALNPADSNYLFFVANESGGHSFSVEYDEHLDHVAAWRRHNRSSSN